MHRCENAGADLRGQFTRVRGQLTKVYFYPQAIRANMLRLALANGVK